jgi:hypothetical protein
VEGNNELAVALVITIPLLYFLSLQVEKVVTLPVLRPIGKTWVRRGIYVTMFLCAVAAIGSHSGRAAVDRGDVLGVLVAQQSSSLDRPRAPDPLSGDGPFMPEEWTSRMETIKTYDRMNRRWGVSTPG